LESIQQFDQLTKEFAKNGHPKYGGGYKGLLFDAEKENIYTKEVITPALRQLEQIGVYPPSVDVQTLPLYSFFLQVSFILATPSLIRGDDTFYIHDNPVLKEQAFKLPYFPGSTWKGHFRTQAQRLMVEEKRGSAASFFRLFGVQRGEDAEEDGRGRLRFYPTFFDSIGLSVINPHSRKTKAGTIPILEEIIPENAHGVFSLLYVPYDLIDEADSNTIKMEVAEDLQFILQTFGEVFHTYGFSAKSTRGFGLAKGKYMQKDKTPGGTIAVSGVKVNGTPALQFVQLNQFQKVVNDIIRTLAS
jgi:CRISPR-associated protein Cmr2